MSAFCPGMEELSAYADGELAATELAAMEAHLARCPACGAKIGELAELGRGLAVLRSTRLDVDLAPAVLARLPRRARGEESIAPPRAGPWWRRLFAGSMWSGMRPGDGSALAASWLRLTPSALAGVSLAVAGFYLGIALTADASLAQPPARMAAFAAVPPGGLCLGLSSCPAPGAVR